MGPKAMAAAAGLAASLLAVLVAASPALGDGPGGYGNDPYAWIHAGSYETEETVLFDEASSNWTWGASPIIGSAYCLGDIREGQAGTAKASSQINYHDPYGTGSLSIGGDVETWKPFLVTSGSLSLGTQVAVTLAVGYEGTLQALEGVEGKYSYSRASGAVTLYADDGSVLGARSGQAEVECEMLDGEWEFISEATGNWTGLLVQGTDGLGRAIYSLDYEDQITFTAVVGDRYWLYFDLATSTNSSSGSALGWEDSTTYAKADFASTATYLLSSNSDVQFQIVPEPATLGLLALGGLALVRRRRTA